MEIPVDANAEGIVIGRLLISHLAVLEVADKLQPDEFFHAEYQDIVSAIKKLHATGKAVEPDSVFAVMQDAGSKHADLLMLHGMAQQMVGYTEDVKFYVERIKAYSALRRYIALSHKVRSMACEKSDPADICAFINQSNEDITRNDDQFTIRDLAKQYKLEYRESGRNFLQYVEMKQEQYIRGISTLSGFPSGYPKLDEMLDGFNRGHFIIIGARPGVGKTTFVLNLIRRFIDRSLTVGFLSLEMDVEDVALLYACGRAELGSKRVKHGKINGMEFQRLAASVQTLKQEKLYIEDAGSLTIHQVESRVRHLVKHCGIQMLFVDYIGEIKGSKKHASKQEEMQEVSRALRNIAKKYKLPIVCIAQLNRESEKAARVPRKSDLRETGQIEADAHSIILLDRPETGDKSEQPGLLNAHIVKNRFGEEGVVQFNFEGDKGIITELASITEDMERVNNFYGKSTFT